KREAVSHALCAGEHFPVYSVHYSAGVDDSVYARDRRDVDWFTGSYCPADRWRGTVYRPYGGKRPAGNPNRPDRSFPRYGCDANADRSQSSAARGAAWAGERSNHHAYHPGRLFRDGRRRRCWRFRPDWISVRLYWL